MNKIGKKLFASLMAVSIVSVYPLQALALSKEETVYANLDYTGSVSNTVVTSHLSYVGSDEVQDETLLKDILNVNGDETFTLDNNTLTWNGNNQDIFYQGTIKKTLPIEVKVTYYLDGKEVNAKDIIGKSGNIKIKYDFTNNSSKVVDGKTLYTPFVSTLGFMLDGNTTSNVSIDNGKVVSTGTKNMVVGIAAPGLYQSMGLYELKGLNSLTVEYTTTDFEIANMYVVSTPKLLSEASFDVFDKMDTLATAVSLLQSNMDKIEAGANQLLDGASKLDDGTSTLVESLQTVKDGIDKLQAGAVKLDAGIDQIISQLQTAKENLEANSANIQTLQATNLSAANNILSQLEAGVTASLADPTTKAGFLAQVGLSETVYDSLDAATKKTVLDGYIEGVYNNFKDQSTAVQEAYGVTSLVTNYGLYKLIMTDYATIKSLSESLTTLITRLDAAMESNGTNGVKDATAQLSAGLTKIQAGMTKIYAGSVTLSDGATTLKNGLQTLTTGIESFNDEGICVLSDYTNQIMDYASIAKELEQMSKDYQGFASSNSDTTTFVYVLK